MRTCLLALVAAAATAFAADPPKPAAQPEEWKPLFNGKDLDGWTPKITGHKLGENFGDTFRVADGMIQVRYDQYQQFDGQFGHLFHKDKLSHYRLRVEYRFVGEQAKGGPGWATKNSGVMLHCQEPRTMAQDQKFPVSAEAQFHGGLGKGPRPTLSVCTPGTNIVIGGKLVTQHCNLSKAKTFAGNEWVLAEVEVRGAGTVKHYVNGELVMEYEQIQYDPADAEGKAFIKDGVKLVKEGYIALQSESHPIDFRKVEVMRLE